MGDDNGNRNEIDDNVIGGDDLLYAFKQDESQETVDMDKMDQNLLDSANDILGIPEFNKNAPLSSEDQDDNLNKIINSVTDVRNNICINNSDREKRILVIQ